MSSLLPFWNQHRTTIMAIPMFNLIPKSGIAPHLAAARSPVTDPPQVTAKTRLPWQGLCFKFAGRLCCQPDEQDSSIHTHHTTSQSSSDARRYPMPMFVVLSSIRDLAYDSLS